VLDFGWQRAEAVGKLGAEGLDLGSSSTSARRR